MKFDPNGFVEGLWIATIIACALGFLVLIGSILNEVPEIPCAVAIVIGYGIWRGFSEARK